MKDLGRHNNWGLDWNVESLRKRIWNGQSQAHAAVNQAIKTGVLQPASKFHCIDCETKLATEYDHRDYGKPLDVEPVCRSCNALRGRAFPKKWSAEEAAKMTRQRVMKSIDWRMATNPDLTSEECEKWHVHNWVLARKTVLANWVAARQVFRLRDAAPELFPETEAAGYEIWATDECLKFYSWMR